MPGKRKHIRDADKLIALGQNLRRIRKEKGLSMMALADYCNVDYSQIKRIEYGQINTTISTLYEIAKVLEVHVRDLFPD